MLHRFLLTYFEQVERMSKGFFISCAIDYPNAKLHMGHVYETVAVSCRVPSEW